MIRVEKLEDVEMEEIEAIAALADQEEGAPGEEGGDGVGTAEAENQSGEDRGHEAAVDEEVGGMAYEGVEEESDGGQAASGECEALTLRESKSVLQFAEGDSSKEGADVGERGVLEEPDELAGAVAIDWADDVVGVQVEIEGVGDEADDPEADEEEHQVQGPFGPR
jgi:hypothetical protein